MTTQVPKGKGKGLEGRVESGAEKRDYLSKLPGEIVEFIAKKLYVVDYINFRAVCQTFQQVLPRINWREALFKLEFPSLIVKSRSDIHTLIDPHMGDDVQLQPRWKTLAELKSPDHHDLCQNFLVECDGKLLLVFVDESVHVYKLNFEPVMVWEEVNSLGKHALFLSPSSCFSQIPNCSDMENKIYFPKLFGDVLVYYCLRTHKFYTAGAGNKQVVPDFYNTTQFLSSCWIDPRWG
ncbi:hypothetical protein COLO4_36746 [Corchorus olitorius]|uniref:F-box domain-containing protein n=1 Tax=Corchorus olitorius TaxID=93759 RepID=A0A1R3G5R4_9ROSI|nr:hypothetical protein COLO4_36746 [Corchorus olitorius]